MTKDQISVLFEQTLREACDAGKAFDFYRLYQLIEEKAREEEREACAKVCDDWPNGRDDVYSIGEAIRARGKET